MGPEVQTKRSYRWCHIHPDGLELSYAPVNQNSTAAGASDSGATRARPWRPNELVPNVTGRLSRSATMALLLSPIGLLLLAVIRLLIISNYNTTTALAVASSGGYVNTLLGTLIPMVPVLLPYLALGLLFFNRVTLGILALAATALISPTAASKRSFLNFFEEVWRRPNSQSSQGLLFLAALAVIILFVQFMTGGWAAASRLFFTIMCILLVPLILLLYPLPDRNSFYAQLIRQPWLPTESIKLASGASLTGYILSEDGHWITFLDDGNRRIYYYLPGQITQRQVCQSSAIPVTSPLISLLPSKATSISKATPCAISTSYNFPNSPAAHRTVIATAGPWMKH
jgi:hypothetical protein